MVKPLTAAEFQQSVADAFSTAVESTCQDLIKAAVEAEREACAKLCDHMEEQAEGVECCKWPTPADCAHVIRARSQA